VRGTPRRCLRSSPEKNPGWGASGSRKHEEADTADRRFIPNAPPVPPKAGEPNQYSEHGSHQTPRGNLGE